MGIDVGGTPLLARTINRDQKGEGEVMLIGDAKMRN